MRPDRSFLAGIFLLAISPALFGQYREIASIQWPNSLPVSRVVFSSDSLHLASVGGDYTVRIWDVATKQLLRSITDSSSTPNYSWPMHFSNDGRKLVKASYDGIKVWDIQSGGLLDQLQVPSVSEISPDLRFSASTDYGSGGYGIVLLGLPGGDSIHRYRLGASYPQAISFSTHGSMIATGQQDGRIRLFSTTIGDSLLSIQAHGTTSYGSTIGGIAFSPDEQYMASGGGDRIIKLWNAATGELVRRMVGHTDWITALDFSPDGEYLASASADGTIRVWSVATGENLHTYDEYPGIQDAVAFSPDMRYIASGTQDGAVILWNAKYSRTSDVGDRTGTTAGGLVLERNRPNPFTGSTTLRFSMTRPAHVTLDIYNLYGQRIATLLDESMEAGEHEAIWDGAGQPSGWYYYRLASGGSSLMRSMLLQK
jgi:WD40 repeat protein